MAENKPKDDDKQQAPAKESKSFDCTACGGKSTTETVCSKCGTMLRA